MDFENLDYANKVILVVMVGLTILERFVTLWEHIAERRKQRAHEVSAGQAHMASGDREDEKLLSSGDGAPPFRQPRTRAELPK